MKKLLITLFVLILGTGFMAYLYFSNLKTGSNSNNIPLHTVSSQSAVIFTFESDKSFYEIIDGQNLLSNVLGEKKWKILSHLKQYIDEPRFAKTINGQKIHIGFIPNDKNNEISFLLATQTNTPINLQSLLDRKNDTLAKFSKIKNYYSAKFTDSTQIFLASIHKTIFVTDNETAIQKSLIDNETEGTPFNVFIAANSQQNKNTLANLYIDYRNISPLLKKALSIKLNGALEIFNQTNAFAALSYNFGKEKLLFNGYTSFGNAENYLNSFIDEKEQPIFIDQILPNSTANYTIYTVNDYKLWQEKLYSINTEHDKTAEDIKKIDRKYRLNLDEIFPKYFKKQFIDFQLSTGEKLGAIALTNGDKVTQLLIDLSSEYAPDINIFKESHILYHYFGNPFKKFERPFFTIIDNYMIFANNASTIQSFLNSYKQNKLLINTEEKSQFNDQLSSSATLFFYVNNNNSVDMFSRNLNKDFYNHYRNKNGFKDYNAFCYQLSADNGKFLTNLLMLKNITHTKDTTNNKLTTK